VAELRHLRTFKEAAERGSFVRAAEVLRYAQPTVTLHVRQLERAFGAKLFEKEGRGMRLTEAGRALKGHADAVLDRASRMELAMAELTTGEAGHVRLGSIEPTASLRLPGLLVRFCDERPRVRLTVEVGGTEAVSHRVAAGELDAGICSPPPAELGLSFEPLFVEELALLVPQDHPLAGADGVRVEDLARHRLLLSERPCAYRRAAERTLAERGANLRPGVEIGAIEIGGLEAIKRAVCAGLGAALLPSASLEPAPRGAVARELVGVELGLPVGLVSAPGNGPRGRASEALFAELQRLRA
jgi:DNA-binding transcriptional LysR family regulator